MKNYLTTEEAATVIGVSRRQVERYIKSGKLPAQKNKNRYRIMPADALKIKAAHSGREGRDVWRPSLDELKAVIANAGATQIWDTMLNGIQCETYVLRSESRIKALDALITGVSTHRDGYRAQAVRSELGGDYIYIVAYHNDQIF